MRIKNEKGITLVALAITIIVLLIIVGIGYNYGKDAIQRAQLEELRTNMLLIEAKAKGLVEEVNFKIGMTKEGDSDYTSKKDAAENEVYVGSGLEKVTNASDVSSPSAIPATECYKVTDTAFKNWGLEDIKLEKNEYYLIKFDDTNATVEVYNTLGYDGKYSLTDIDNLEV